MAASAKEDLEDNLDLTYQRASDRPSKERDLLQHWCHKYMLRTCHFWSVFFFPLCTIFELQTPTWKICLISWWYIMLLMICIHLWLRQTTRNLQKIYTCAFPRFSGKFFFFFLFYIMLWHNQRCSMLLLMFDHLVDNMILIMLWLKVLSKWHASTS